jgi:EAL domain-containing protein (putative c-di-GMP-specific phosphodiesterase class I)
MRTGWVIGAEALIRWQHPERGLLPPEIFLPEVEHEHLATAIGEWVLNAVLDQIEAWHAQGLNLTVSVNVGARQLLAPEFADRLGAALAAHPPVQPSEIEIEVRESHAMQDIAQVTQVIQKCAHMGVGFTLDHSGTGYASLAYMERLRVSRLKIDPSFVRESLDHPADTAVLQGIIGLATAFKWDVIAQGLETTAHCKQLLALGCDIVQGYCIAPPMAAEQLSNWLAHWKPEADWISAP